MANHGSRRCDFNFSAVSCNKGINCSFSHDNSLRYVDPSKICETFFADGKMCKYGISGLGCPFSHNMDRDPRGKKQNVCKFYLSGSCDFGAKCKDLHVGKPKKEVCTYHQTGKGCKYGDKCINLHQGPPGGKKNPKLVTVCQFYRSKDGCQYGDDCINLHQDPPEITRRRRSPKKVTDPFGGLTDSDDDLPVLQPAPDPIGLPDLEVPGDQSSPTSATSPNSVSSPSSVGGNSNKYCRSIHFLPVNIGEQELKDFFSDVCDIEEVFIERNEDAGQMCRIAVVKCPTAALAKTALETLDGKLIETGAGEKPVLIETVGSSENPFTEDFVQQDRNWAALNYRNFPKNVNEASALEIFGDYGKVKYLKQFKKGVGERSGAGLVIFDTWVSAFSAAQDLQGTKPDGFSKNVRLCYARPALLPERSKIEKWEPAGKPAGKPSPVKPRGGVDICKVFYLPYKFDEDDLRAFFAPVCDVQQVLIKSHRGGGTGLKVGYVQCEDADTVGKAQKELNGKPAASDQTRCLTVQYDFKKRTIGDIEENKDENDLELQWEKFRFRSFPSGFSPDQAKQVFQDYGDVKDFKSETAGRFRTGTVTFESAKKAVIATLALNATKPDGFDTPIAMQVYQQRPPSGPEKRKSVCKCFYLPDSMDEEGLRGFFRPVCEVTEVIIKELKAPDSTLRIGYVQCPRPQSALQASQKLCGNQAGDTPEVRLFVSKLSAQDIENPFIEKPEGKSEEMKIEDIQWEFVLFTKFPPNLNAAKIRKCFAKIAPVKAMHLYTDFKGKNRGGRRRGRGGRGGGGRGGGGRGGRGGRGGEGMSTGEGIVRFHVASKAVKVATKMNGTIPEGCKSPISVTVAPPKNRIPPKMLQDSRPVRPRPNPVKPFRIKSPGPRRPDPDIRFAKADWYYITDQRRDNTSKGPIKGTYLKKLYQQKKLLRNSMVHSGITRGQWRSVTDVGGLLKFLDPNPGPAPPPVPNSVPPLPPQPPLPDQPDQPPLPDQELYADTWYYVPFPNINRNPLGPVSKKRLQHLYKIRQLRKFSFVRDSCSEQDAQWKTVENSADLLKFLDPTRPARPRPRHQIDRPESKNRWDYIPFPRSNQDHRGPVNMTCLKKLYRENRLRTFSLIYDRDNPDNEWNELSKMQELMKFIDPDKPPPPSGIKQGHGQGQGQRPRGAFVPGVTISGFKEQTANEKIEEFAKQYGELRRSIHRPDPGFAVVFYLRQASAAKLMNDLMPTLDDDVLTAKIPSQWIYVRLSSTEVKEDELRNYFEEYGSIDNLTFGHKGDFSVWCLRFDKEEFRNKVLEQESHHIGDHTAVCFRRPPPKFKAFVGNVAKTASEDELRETFGKYGEVIDVWIPPEKDGKFKAIAFITFKHQSALKWAILESRAGTIVIQGRKLHVDNTRDSQQKGPGKQDSSGSEALLAMFLQNQRKHEEEIERVKGEQEEKQKQMLRQYDSDRKEQDAKLQDAFDQQMKDFKGKLGIKMKIQWEWRDEEDEWQAYDEDISKKIEDSYENTSGTEQVHFKIDNGFTYTIFVADEKQVNDSVGTERVIRRTEYAVGGDDIEQQPPFWKSEDLGKETKVVRLDSSSQEYKFVATEFQKTTSNTIISIEYVVNEPKWVGYCGVYKVFKKNLGKDKVDERYLWHATNHGIIKTICVQGFVRDYTTVHAYGKGVYFARDSSYSANSRYSPRDASGHGRMFLASVLVGETVVGQSSAMRPPTKPGTLVEYETMVDSTSNPSVFVATQDYQAYPKFLVTFQG